MNNKPFYHRLYSLHKSRGILTWANSCYKRQHDALNQDELREFEQNLKSLDDAILEGDRNKADTYARKVESFANQRFKKPVSNAALEIVFALVFALVVATIIRQVWFEPYEIPTGSMRPTFREQDHLIVSKTAYGINIPFLSQQLYFDPSLLKRGQVMIFSGANIDLPDTSSRYFWIFPYTKRYIKRNIGLPGDTLYFYGGQVYGIDKDGNDLVFLREDPKLKNLEHIPFLNFEGRVSGGPKLDGGRVKQLLFRHANKPIARLLLQPNGLHRGEIFDGDTWVTDQPMKALEPHKEIDTFSDFWGFRNFAMARLLNRDQIENDGKLNVKELGQAPLYLELRHTPSLNRPVNSFLVEQHQSHEWLNPFVTAIPLQKEHIEKIMANLYTSRFTVKDGNALRYSHNQSSFQPDSPRFPNLPDGTYEFYNGIAYEVGFGGMLTKLPKNHPIYDQNLEHIQKLFNLGVEFTTIMNPGFTGAPVFPARFGYFRNGDFYLLGAPLFKKDDPALVEFNKKEEEKQNSSPKGNPYIAFKDYGPPLKNGVIDREFIETFGLKVPEDHYFVLGDNHSVSADSRYFGFVPAKNIEGAPSFLFWPPGERWGNISDFRRDWLTVPNIVIWSLAALTLLIVFLYYRWKMQQPTFRPIDRDKR